MRPKVVIYNAASVDGRLAGLDVDMERYYGLAGKWREDATLVGSGTILKSDEEVPPEDGSAFEEAPAVRGDRRAILAVVDSGGRVRTWHALKKAGFWRGFVALCSRSTPGDYFGYLKRRHVDWVVAGEDKVDLKRALEVLARRHRVRTVRADCGGTLNGVLLRQGLVDEVSVLLHPQLVGGPGPLTLVHEPGPPLKRRLPKLRLLGVERVKGGLVWLRYSTRRT